MAFELFQWFTWYPRMSPKESAPCSKFKFLSGANGNFLPVCVTEHHLPHIPYHYIVHLPAGIFVSLAQHFQEGCTPRLARWCQLSDGSSAVVVDGGGGPQLLSVCASP